MSYLDHIRACNTHDLSRYRPFRIGDDRVGWVRDDLAERLARFADHLTVTADGVTLNPGLRGFDARTAAMAEIVEALVADGVIPKLRGEAYPVVTRWAADALAKIDRAAVPYFGLRSFGIHVNGFVRKPDGLHLWVGKRAADRGVAPGKFDHLVAGGQPHGLTLDENLIKESAEEAGLPAELACRAAPVGAISYLMENHAGLKPDTLFVYDLELAEDVIPVNSDGEVEYFELWPIDRVAARVRDTDDFKFNVNLVVIDFLIRHGYLTPKDRDYLPLVIGLRRDLGD
jgi:8-oxo-dGTP pyrophosphatase MutT (NUDIX family)